MNPRSLISDSALGATAGIIATGAMDLVTTSGPTSTKPSSPGPVPRSTLAAATTIEVGWALQRRRRG
jgi:lysozyme family protein